MVWGKGSTSFFCMWISSCPGIICWKDYAFSIECSLHCCQKSVDHRYMGVSVLSILVPWFMYLALCNTTLSWLLLLCSKFWIQKVWVLLLCHSFSRLFWLSLVPYNSIETLEPACQFLQRSHLGFWQRLCWISLQVLHFFTRGVYLPSVGPWE